MAPLTLTNDPKQPPLGGIIGTDDNASCMARVTAMSFKAWQAWRPYTDTGTVLALWRK